MPKEVTVPQNAAILSWNSAIGAAILGVLCRLIRDHYEAQDLDVGIYMPWIMNGTAVFLIFVGLASGAWALSRVKTEGPKGIVIPAMIGIGLNIFLLVVAITAFMIVWRRDHPPAAVHSDTLSQPMEFHSKFS